MPVNQPRNIWVNKLSALTIIIPIILGYLSLNQNPWFNFVTSVVNLVHPFSSPDTERMCVCRKHRPNAVINEPSSSKHYSQFSNSNHFSASQFTFRCYIFSVSERITTHCSAHFVKWIKMVGRALCIRGTYGCALVIYLPLITETCYFNEMLK